MCTPTVYFVGVTTCTKKFLMVVCAHTARPVGLTTFTRQFQKDVCTHTVRPVGLMTFTRQFQKDVCTHTAHPVDIKTAPDGARRFAAIAKNINPRHHLQASGCCAMKRRRETKE